MTDPQRPRARSLSAALARIVRARAVNPRFIAGQMRHGPRGAAELAETVDRLVAFAETTDAVASELFDLLHEAYVADPNVRDFLLRENPQRCRSDRRTARRRAAARFLASAPQRCRCRPRGTARRVQPGSAMRAAMFGQNLASPLPAPLRQREEHVQRRGACPGLSAPMPTGDGLLVRLLPIGTIPLDAFAALCAAAQAHGNGVIEVTARGSIQVRGLDCRIGAALRGGRRRARHCGGGRHSGSQQCARRTRSGRDARRQRARRAICALRSRADRSPQGLAQSLGCHRRRRAAQPR